MLCHRHSEWMFGLTHILYLTDWAGELVDQAGGLRSGLGCFV